MKCKTFINCQKKNAFLIMSWKFLDHFREFHSVQIISFEGIWDDNMKSHTLWKMHYKGILSKSWTVQPNQTHEHHLIRWSWVIWHYAALTHLDTADAHNWSKLAAKRFPRVSHIILTNNIRLKNDLLSVSLKSKHYNIVQNLQEDGFLNAGDFIA